MRIWGWLNQRKVLITAKTKELNLLWVLMDLGSSSCYQSGRLMPLRPPSRSHTLKPLGPTTKIPDYIPIHLPYKSEKCYYERVDDVGVYEQVLKAGLRFPLSSLHCERLKYLGLFVSQISPNAWRIFIAMEVLNRAMSNGAKALTVREFLHCYRPDEIDKSKGMYSFDPRKSVLKMIFKTLDSNRD